MGYKGDFYEKLEVVRGVRPCRGGKGEGGVSRKALHAMLVPLPFTRLVPAYFTRRAVAWKQASPFLLAGFDESAVAAIRGLNLMLTDNPALQEGQASN